MGFKRALRVWDALPRDYRRRWGLASGLRRFSGLRRRAGTIRSREIYRQYAVFLENLWTLHKMGEAERRRMPLDQMGRPLVRVKDFTIDFRYFILIGYSLEPP